MNTISAWSRRAQIPHRGGTSGTPRTCKGLFSAYTQALHGHDLPEEDIRVLNKIIPDPLFDLRSAGEAFEDMKQMGLSGASPLGEVKTKAPNSRLPQPQGRATGRSTARGGRAGLPQARGEDRRAQRPPAGLRRAYGHRAQEVQRGPARRTTAPTAQRCRRTRAFRTATSFLTTPRGGTTPLPRHAQPLLLLFRSNPPLRGGDK